MAESRRVRVELCIPVTVEVVGYVDEGGEIVIEQAQVPGEMIHERDLFEHLDGESYDYLAERLEASDG